MIDIKVNVRTGKKGYYKRTQAVDKTTTMKINIHESDDAVGADSDLHDRIFAKSSKALGHHDTALDALDLPFFQLGRHPLAVAIVESRYRNPGGSPTRSDVYT